MGTPVATVLAVRGELSSLDAVTPGLRREGFAVIEVASSEEALARFDAIRPDAVLLDATLSGISGIDLCRVLRTQSMVPILVFSVWADDVDLVIALEVGADAYLTPPFRLREIIARLRALSHRAKDTRTLFDEDRVLVAGGLRLDIEHRIVRVGDREIRLTPHEFGILEMLMDNAGRLVTREELIDRVWNGAVTGDPRTVDVQVNSLRAKIEGDAHSAQLIKTVRGLGYRFENQEQARRTASE